MADAAKKEPASWKPLIILFSLLGAAGTALQNYQGFFSFLGGITRFSSGLCQGLAVTLGGVCSGIINLCINIELLNDFIKRCYPTSKEEQLKKEERIKHHKKFTFWQKLQYYLGSVIFIITGILFGLTALSFGSIGALAIIGIAAGIFVSIIMMIQELETWLKAFDPPDNHSALNYPPSALRAPSPARGEGIYSTKSPQRGKGLNKKGMLYWVGSIIALGNVLALSLLFTLGLAGFLITLGSPPFAAVIAGLSIAFTIGSFTEFYFYNFFLAEFCEKISEKWEKLCATTSPVLGILSITVNGLVNGALCYSGVLLLNPLFIAAGLAVPSIALAIVAAVFGGLASLLLGADFWIRNCNVIFNFLFGVKDNSNDYSKLDKESSQDNKTLLFQPPISIKAPPSPARGGGISALTSHPEDQNTQTCTQQQEGEGPQYQSSLVQGRV